MDQLSGNLNICTFNVENFVKIDEIIEEIKKIFKDNTIILLQEYKPENSFSKYCKDNNINIVSEDDKRVAIIYKFNDELKVTPIHEFILMLKPEKLSRLEKMYTHIKKTICIDL